MKSITLGQYFAGNSILHRLDPRAKIILAILYIVVTFLCKNVFSFALLVASVFILIAISKIPVKIILGGIKPILYIMIFTVIINVFWTKGEGAPLVSWSFIKIYKEGLISALLMMLRIVSLIIGTGIFLTYTTSPIVLTDAIEQLLDPLKKIKVPVHEFAMMMTIALRFIPTLVEETDKIMNAQKARGADFSHGSLAARAKALIPILVPLFISAFRRADELAVAMECRCYRGGEGRTRMTKLKYSAKDAAALFVVFLFGACVVLLNIYAPGFSM